MHDDKNYKIGIILVEDHLVLRQGLRMLIDAQPDMAVVAEAADGESALAYLSTGIPTDVIISDLNMPGMNGFLLLEQLLNTQISVYSIALTMLDGQKNVEEAFRMGVSGYLSKSVEAEELLFAIRQVAAGKKYVCSETLGSILFNMYKPKTPRVAVEILPEFTAQELELLQMVAEGMTNVEIGDKIFLSKRTVEGHRRSLMDKTNSKNTAMLIKFAMIHGLVQ